MREMGIGALRVWSGSGVVEVLRFWYGVTCGTYLTVAGGCWVGRLDGGRRGREVGFR